MCSLLLVAFSSPLMRRSVRLTDETIRENLERYGHPDGRQEVSMGIALPKGIVEGRNRLYVLAAYGVIFGAMLPALVGRWWFGNREKTKDGVNARSAAAFFKSLTEESGIDEVVGTLGKSFEWERSQLKSKAAELDELESRIKAKLGSKWATLKQFAEVGKEQYETRRRAFILLYAHLLRLSISSSSLRAGQSSQSFSRIRLRTHLAFALSRTIQYTSSNPNTTQLLAQYQHFAKLACTHPRCHAFARLPRTSSYPRRIVSKICTITRHQ